MLSRLRRYWEDHAAPVPLPPEERPETAAETIDRLTRDVAVHQAAARRYQDVAHRANVEADEARAQMRDLVDGLNDMARDAGKITQSAMTHADRLRAQRIAALDLLADGDWPADAAPLVAQVRAALGDRSALTRPLSPVALGGAA